MRHALLLSLIAASYLLLAGGPQWTVLPLIAWTGVCLLVVRPALFTGVTRSLDLALVALCASVAAQLVPLPAAVLNAVSPHATELKSTLQFAIGPQTATGWTSLSVSPETTAYALGRLTLGVGSFWLARGVFSRNGQTRLFCRVLALLGGAAAVVAIVQRAVAPGLLMGLVRPDALNANPFGPFLNRNHFAAWMLMAAVTGMGYLTAHLQMHAPSRHRIQSSVVQFLASGALLTMVAIILAVAALLMTLSRSAAVGLCAALAVGGLLGRSRLVASGALKPVIAAIAIGALVVASFINVDGWFSRLQRSLGMADAEFSRLTIWRESLPIMRDFVVAGTGAGTYGDAMGHYQQTRFWIGSMQQWAHFNNAHSHYVQLVSEGGLLTLIPAILVIVLVMRLGLQAIRADRGPIFWVRVGAASALSGIAVQSIWEVPLIMPANAVLAGALAGLLLAQREGAGGAANGRDTTGALAPHP